MTHFHILTCIQLPSWHNYWSEEELSAVHKDDGEMEIHAWRVLHVKISYEGDGSL